MVRFLFWAKHVRSNILIFRRESTGREAVPWCEGVSPGEMLSAVGLRQSRLRVSNIQQCSWLVDWIIRLKVKHIFLVNVIFRFRTSWTVLAWKMFVCFSLGLFKNVDCSIWKAYFCVLPPYTDVFVLKTVGLNSSMEHMSKIQAFWDVFSHNAYF